MQDRIVGPLLARDTPIAQLPFAAQLLENVPLLRRIPAQVVGMGFRPEHVCSPDAFAAF